MMMFGHASLASISKRNFQCLLLFKRAIENFFFFGGIYLYFVIIENLLSIMSLF